MTVQSPVVIGELVVEGARLGQKRYPIEACPGYGVICYPLGTLNGSIPAIAQGLVTKTADQHQMRNELDDSTYTVTVVLDGVVVNCQDPGVVSEQLTALYKRHAQD